MLRVDDSVPSEVPGLQWLVNSPKLEAVAVDEWDGSGRELGHEAHRGSKARTIYTKQGKVSAMLILTLSLLFSFLASWFLVGRFCLCALAQGLLDNPNARSSHTLATPRGGGGRVSFLGGMVVGAGAGIFARGGAAGGYRLLG